MSICVTFDRCAGMQVFPASNVPAGTKKSFNTYTQTVPYVCVTVDVNAISVPLNPRSGVTGY